MTHKLANASCLLGHLSLHFFLKKISGTQIMVHFPSTPPVFATSDEYQFRSSASECRYGHLCHFPSHEKIPCPNYPQCLEWNDPLTGVVCNLSHYTWFRRSFCRVTLSGRELVMSMTLVLQGVEHDGFANFLTWCRRSLVPRRVGEKCNAAQRHVQAADI